MNKDLEKQELRICDCCYKATPAIDQSSCVTSHVEIDHYREYITDGIDECNDALFYCPDCLNDLGFCKHCAGKIDRGIQKQMIKDVWGEDA